MTNIAIKLESITSLVLGDEVLGTHDQQYIPARILFYEKDTQIAIQEFESQEMAEEVYNSICESMGLVDLREFQKDK